MPFVAGADGCRAGWIAIVLDTDTRRIGSKPFPTVAGLLHHLNGLSVIAIDVPIGLCDDHPRSCDRAARKRLGPKRGTSVFPAPIRPLIETMRESRRERRGVTSDGVFTYRNACSLSESITGKKISKQAWQIFPKILEVDDVFVNEPSLQEKLIEVHPEVSFAAWAGAPIIESKKRPAGEARRRTLVDTHFGPTAYEAVRRRYRRGEVANDDILDAFAALWTAERELKQVAQRLPEHPSFDSRGLRMQIVY